MAFNKFDIPAPIGVTKFRKHRIAVHICAVGIVRESDIDSDAPQKNNLGGDEVAFGLDEKVNYISDVVELTISRNCLSCYQRIQFCLRN